MFKIFTKLFGSKYDRDVKAYSPVVELINEFAEAYQKLTNEELRNKTLEFRERIAAYLSDIDHEITSLRTDAEEDTDFSVKEELYKELDEAVKERDKSLEVILKEMLPEAFAVVKETCRRLFQNETLPTLATDHDRNLAAVKSYVTIEGDKAIWKNEWMAAGGLIKWNMIPYDVQLIGGMVLHDGKIAEMGTGEGKTLVATLPSYLNALAGLGVHIVTVNDYLARRDSEWVGPIFEFLMMHDRDPFNRWQAAQTYATNLLTAAARGRDESQLVWGDEAARLAQALGVTANDDALLPAYRAEFLRLPSESDIAYGRPVSHAASSPALLSSLSANTKFRPVNCEAT